MDPRTQAVVRGLDERANREYEEIRTLDAAALERRRDDFLLPIGPEVGQFIHTLIRGLRAKVVLELGTCRGYSTLWLADAARDIQGRVITFENDAAKQAEAKANIRQAALQDYVEYRLGKL